MAIPGQKSKGIKWKILYAFTGIVDVAQIIMDMTGVGLVVSEFIEGAMPFIIIPALQFTGVSLIERPNRLISIIGATGLDAITGGIAPFWIVDIWYIHRDVKAEDVEYNAQKEQDEQLQNSVRQPLNQSGVRSPQAQYSGPKPPVIKDGIRAPGGGMKPPIINDMKPPVIE